MKIFYMTPLTALPVQRLLWALSHCVTVNVFLVGARDIKNREPVYRVVSELMGAVCSYCILKLGTVSVYLPDLLDEDIIQLTI